MVRYNIFMIACISTKFAKTLRNVIKPLKPLMSARNILEVDSGNLVSIATLGQEKVILAAIQMCSSNDKLRNIEKIESLAFQASNLGANFICLPENCIFMGKDSNEVIAAAEPPNGPSTVSLCELSLRLGIWLSVGSIHEIVDDPESIKPRKISNVHILISPQGKVVGRYKKV